MPLRKLLSTGLVFVLLAAAWTPLYAAQARRTSVSSSSRAAVSSHRGSATVRRSGSAAHTRRATGVSTASRSAVRHTTVVSSRSYVHRGVTVYRPHGHYYHGYGHYHGDDDAWK